MKRGDRVLFCLFIVLPLILNTTLAYMNWPARPGLVALNTFSAGISCGAVLFMLGTKMWGKP